MSDGTTYTDIPEVLHPVLEKALERLQQHDDWSNIVGRDSKVAGVLNRVLASSEYIADVLARYPQALADIIADGRIHRPLEPGELEPVFLTASVDKESDDQFMRRLRIFRHRELMRIAN